MIPAKVEGSFYSGKVYFRLSSHTFNPSTPLKHMLRLLDVIGQQTCKRPAVLLAYTDGGPDHNVKHPSVKIAWSVVALVLRPDFIHAQRTAPGNSWANPCERTMSLFNIALQGW